MKTIDVSIINIEELINMLSNKIKECKSVDEQFKMILEDVHQYYNKFYNAKCLEDKLSIIEVYYAYLKTILKITDEDFDKIDDVTLDHMAQAIENMSKLANNIAMNIKGLIMNRIISKHANKYKKQSTPQKDIDYSKYTKEELIAFLKKDNVV